MERVAPVQVTFEVRNFDALVGLTAPVVAAGIAIGWLSPQITIAWNLFGLAMRFILRAELNETFPIRTIVIDVCL
jgi:hypothetical protein